MGLCMCLFEGYSFYQHYSFFFFFFNDTATTEIYTLSLHDALPILRRYQDQFAAVMGATSGIRRAGAAALDLVRSEEHTSELQSQSNLVCRLLLEKKKNIKSQFAQSSSPLSSSDATKSHSSTTSSSD